MLKGITSTSHDRDRRRERRDTDSVKFWFINKINNHNNNNIKENHIAQSFQSR